MARKASPWYREERNIWMVTIDGKRHTLGEHPAEAKKPEKSKKTGLWNPPESILNEFYKLIQTPQRKITGKSVAAILDSFLSFCYENRAKRTADRYKDFMDDFCQSYGLYSVEELDSGHVTDWLTKKTTWNSTTKHNAITALSRGFNWACNNAGLKVNPIRGMEKPEAKNRTTILTDKEFTALLSHVKGAFHDLLIVAYDSGARPQEVKNLEARHLEITKSRAVIPAEEAKGKRPRAIYFPTPRSMAVIKRLAKVNPTGPIFRNSRGNKWTGFAVKCRFEDLEEKIGKRLNQYALRHTFITRKLIAGVDSHVVASLAGHRDTAMIHKVYSHVAEDHAFMLKEAKK